MYFIYFYFFYFQIFILLNSKTFDWRCKCFLVLHFSLAMYRDKQSVKIRLNKSYMH